MLDVKVTTFEEGYRTAPYYCTEGYPTFGIGKKLGPKNAPLSNYEIAIPECVAEKWLDVDMEGLRQRMSALSWYRKQNDDRKAILVSMAYQMGLTGLLKFKKTLAALDSGNYELAAIEALDSLWAKQTQARAERHVIVLRTGDIKDAYEGLIDV